MLIYKAIGGQNIFDIALQTYGNVQDVVKLLVDNPGLDLNQEIEIGFEIKYQDQENEFKTFVTNKKIQVATNDGVTQSGNAFGEAFDKKAFK
ncbi:MAG: hypothetical protein GY822_27530 [Deltaproteobacteria bacterium]|nr:hypothetical protein [Deltaproteobacteria bacterium]